MPISELPCDLAITYEKPAQSVLVSGSFNDWARTVDAGASELRLKDGVWTTTLKVPPGKNVYKILVDGVMQDGEKVFQCGLLDQLSRPFPHCDIKEKDWRDSVLYFAMIDRFYDSDGLSTPVPNATTRDPYKESSAQYAGGDFIGLEQKIPYLADLGINSLWLSAPYDNRDKAGAAWDTASDPYLYAAYHGYWPAPEFIDYSNPSTPVPRPRVERRYGSEEDLKSLVRTIHTSEMKVMFDYVMKHVDVESGLYKAKPEWFVTPNGTARVCAAGNLWNDPYWGTRCSFKEYLPSFDFYKAEPLQWSIDDASWWAREFEVDGLRIDAVKHAPLSWIEAMRKRASSLYMVGETYDFGNREKIKQYVNSETLLDGQFDFPLRKQLCEAVLTEGGDLTRLAKFTEDNDRYYNRGMLNPSLMVNFIGNHDIPRAIHVASHQLKSCTEGSTPDNSWSSGRFAQPSDSAAYERLGLSFAFLFTSPGIPLIYYGDEIGLAGGGDPDNRRMMPWNDVALSAPQKALRETVKALAKIRAEHPSITRGNRRTLFADKESWVFEMSGCDKTIAVLMNRSNSVKTVPLETGVYRDLIRNKVVTVRDHWDLEPRMFRILRKD